MTTAAQIYTQATMQGFTTNSVVIDNAEFIAVRLQGFTTAFFRMNEQDFTYTYSHTYNAATDKTTKRKPKGF